MRRQFLAAILVLLLGCALVLPAAAVKGTPISISEDTAVSSYTAEIMSYTIRSDMPGFSSVIQMADRTVTCHPDPEKEGTAESRMLSRIEESKVLMISSFGGMQMSNLRIDGAFGNETDEEKDGRETFNGLNYLRNKTGVELRNGIGKGTLAEYLKKLGAAVPFREALKTELAGTKNNLSLRERYDYLNQSNYVLNGSFAISASPAAERMLAGEEAGSATAEVTITVSGIKYTPRVYLLHQTESGSREILPAAAAENGRYRFLTGMSSLTGHYLILISAETPQDPKCTNHWVLIALWLTALIVMASLRTRRNWPRLAISAAALLISAALCAWSVLIPGCYVDIYVSFFGLFVAYIIVRLKWSKVRYYGW